MRDLKFRAWDKIFKFYVGEDELYLGITFDGKFLIYKDEITDEVEFSKIDDYILEQYTGLKDKNGKEIYEGDIVRYGSDNYEVKFDEMKDSDCTYYYLGWAMGDLSLYELNSAVEVIGNIHENKDLLC